MSNAALAAAAASISILARPNPADSIFRVEGRSSLFLRAGVTIADGGGPARTTETETEVEIPADARAPGSDFYVRLEAGRPVAFRPIAADTAGILGGFHFAPGGNAEARTGGDDVPAINPWSCWDAGFRPACPDPRGMALIVSPALASPFWMDIYLLGVEHLKDGTSRHGVEIAHGSRLPVSPDGEGKARKLDFPTAQAIYAAHGKQLATYDEFRAAAFGVTERSSATRHPGKTALDAARTSRFGIMQATGNVWVWGTDGDPGDPRASILGGSWFGGELAGSRHAGLVYWPENSDDDISARGRSDHPQPA
jgi:hypothetical protein